jgi:hypothetical protein
LNCRAEFNRSVEFKAEDPMAGHGGARPGAGRPKGWKTRRPVLPEVLPRLAEQDQPLPLYRLLDRIADTGLDERYRDALSIVVQPYLHPRLRSDLVAKAPFQMTDAELVAVREAQLQHERQLVRGKPALQLIKR